MAFVGRERELSILGAALDRAARGEPAHVAVSGPLGAGITALFDELVRRLDGASGVTLLRGRCYEPCSGVPYGAVADALAPALSRLSDERLVDVLGPAAFDVAQVISGVGERLIELGMPPQPPTLSAAHQQGTRVREALLGVVDRLAAKGLVCLMIEDLEHADPATREFIAALVRFSGRLRLALVLGLHPDNIPRGDPAHRLERMLDESPAVERVMLSGLSRPEMLVMLEELAGERPTLGFVAAVMEGSQGNPLIAGQLLAAQQDVAGMRLSDDLDEIIEARLMRLEPAQVRVLRVLAAARRPLSIDDLLNLRLADGHLTRAGVTAALDSGLAADIGGEMVIAHEIYAEAIERLTLPRARHRLHAALAEWAVAPGERAWHWRAAGRPAEASAAHREAARAVLPVDPGASAMLHYSMALELAEDAPGDASLLAAAAEAANAAAAFRRAAAYAEQAIEAVAGGRVERLMAGRSGAVEARLRAGELSLLLGEYRRSSGDSVGARQSFEQGVALIPAQAGALRARAMALLAQDLMLEGRFADSARMASQARKLAAASQDALGALAHATDTLAVDLAYEGEIDRALGLLEEALDAGRQAGDLGEVMRGYANMTTVLDLDLRRAKALDVVKEGMTEASRNGLGLTYGAFLRGNAADILFQLGRWEECEAECRAALEFPPAGVAWFSPILYLGLVLVESRADDEAAQLVGRSLLQLETVPAGQWSSLVLRTAVSLALWRGDLDDALNAAAQSWPRVVETDDAGQMASAAALILEAAAAAAQRGRLRRDWSKVADASALASEVLAQAEQRIARHELPASVGARNEAELYLATARAHLERVRGRAKPETWAALAEAWTKVHVPYQAAKARWWQAQAALPDRQKRSEARRALLDAWRIAGELPAQPLRRALRDIADRGRINLPQAELVAIPIVPAAEVETSEEGERPLVPVGPGQHPAEGDLAGRVAASGPVAGEFRFGLSPRESAVLLVLAEGRTNREIAERLFISERTVAVHVRRILAKLGVGGRVEATGLAIRLGLVPSDPHASIDERASVAAGPTG
jgi:DNA-binding CsgD family transcriptional regulator/tetratricopeptide (TPR) repeat protein